MCHYKFEDTGISFGEIKEPHFLHVFMFELNLNQKNIAQQCADFKNEGEARIFKIPNHRVVNFLHG